MANSVDLVDIIPDLQAVVIPFGSTAYDTVPDSQWTAALVQGFWEAILEETIQGYEEADGVVTPIDTNGVALPRQLQQLVILYANITIVRNQLRLMNTKFAVAAGPAKYETDQSATLLNNILASLLDQKAQWVKNLSGSGASASFYTDAVGAREVEIWDNGYTWPSSGWVN